MYQSIYHANCASLVVIKSLSLKKLTNFKMGKLANYFWHLIFVHPVGGTCFAGTFLAPLV